MWSENLPRCQAEIKTPQCSSFPLEAANTSSPGASLLLTANQTEGEEGEIEADNNIYSKAKVVKFQGTRVYKIVWARRVKNFYTFTLKLDDDNFIICCF